MTLLYIMRHYSRGQEQNPCSSQAGCAYGVACCNLIELVQLRHPCGKAGQSCLFTHQHQLSIAYRLLRQLWVLTSSRKRNQ